MCLFFSLLFLLWYFINDSTHTNAQKTHFRYAQSKRSMVCVCQSVDGLSFTVCCTNFYIPCNFFLSNVRRNCQLNTHTHSLALGETRHTLILWNQCKVSTQNRNTAQRNAVQCYALQSILSIKLNEWSNQTKVFLKMYVQDAITSNRKYAGRKTNYLP